MGETVGNFFKWFCRCISEVGVSDLTQLAPQVLSNPMLATGIGAFILLVFGWNAYQQYQEALHSKQLDRISDYLRRLDREQFVTLRDATQKIFIDSEGRMDFGLLTPQERNNPHILLFKVLTERIDAAESRLDALLQSLPNELYGRLALLIREHGSQLVELLQQQDGALAEEFKAALHEMHQVVVDYLKRVEERLTSQGYPPLYIPRCLSEEERFLARLLPKSRWVALTGRDAEMATLHRFLTPDPQRPFKWTLLTGAGGQGKTRLALEMAIQAHAQGWNAGFCRRDANYNDWERWEPQENTLVVMDYVALQAQTARRAILTMAEKAQRNGVQLRLLLLELYFSEQEQWVKDLLAAGSQDATAIRATFWTPVAEDTERLLRHTTLSIQPLSLPPLTEEDFLAIMRAYHDQYCAYNHLSAQPLDESDLRRALQNLPAGDYRPLFAAFAGEAIAEKGIHEVRHWNAQELSEWVLERDFAQWRQRSVDQKHLNLLALATLIGALGIETARRLAREHPNLLPDIDTEFDLAQYNVLTIYSPPENRDQLVGLQPDLLGELFILQRLGNQFQIGGGWHRAEYDTKALIQIAWCEEAITMGQFMVRCAGDFPDHPQLRTLLLLEPKECYGDDEDWDEEEDALSFELLIYKRFFPEAIIQLTTPNSQAVFDELMEKYNPQQQAIIRFNRGLVYHQRGKMDEAIADYTAVIKLSDAPAKLKAESLFNRGVAFYQLGYTEEALADFTAVIEMRDAPTELKAQALLNRGVMYGQLGRTEEALVDYTTVIETPDALAEQKAKALFYRGVVYGQLDHTDEAITDYTALIEMPDAHAKLKAEAFLERGVVYYQLGYSEESLADFTAVIEMSDAPAVLKGLALYNRALVYEQLEELEKAQKDLNTVLTIHSMPEEIRQAVQAWLQGAEE